ncbi:39S ribosomal protein L20, mitochondrial [Orussus abietinus]|uniref:39S ribosomal protein L20, mitochondrial n=1 Tax=Orussus abietinus TaxID=222816 RepID=UPI000625390D|nr:39S ribosomal protein L20, mitochondrial [Orussus abietinus]XP_012288392.1 39S ribosomal protein L20, mitochondrial [Orussus abietinus]XP_012288393.1 39S ribosomal protein L20, mitochondrial [Orussus abietinus]
MVYQSLTLFARSRGPDEFWRKRKIFKLSAHYIGRRRNCYSIAIRNVHRALLYVTRGRKLLKEDMRNLWETRIAAGTEEHGLGSRTLLEGLYRLNIFLNRKVLADLAIWEPRTFRALTKLAWFKAKSDGLNSIKDLDTPTGVVTRGMLK